MDTATRAALYLRYGLPGDPIPGSQLIRAYCAGCGEPIRVAVGANVHRQTCHDCRGLLPRRILNQQHALRNVPR